ncbi:unnamed protein product [Rhizoctonia solani]|uniref:NACHT domain-containing protein n=1 Tax=Rhizoctonia solani TaxID=456999 RepID=A0A8H3HT91_9AGAM|nr:unnamed protein product [Rhizoctonia solani]
METPSKFRRITSSVKSSISQIPEGKDGTSRAPEPSRAVPTTMSGSGTPRWTHLRTFVKALEQATRPLPPLKAAISELAESLGIHDSLLCGRKEYEILHSELEELFQTLQKHCVENIPPAITVTLEALCKIIKDEMEIIERKKGKRKLCEVAEAEQDAESILACYRRIQGHLQRISLNIDLSVWRIVDEVATDNRLNRLSSSLSACYNSAQAIELKRGPCTPGTRVDLLAQVLGWAGSSSPGSMYWVSGMAGTGKTTIAYSLCEELYANRRLGASFFCSRLLPECRDVNLIIPSIAYQLARASRPFRSVLSSVLKSDPDVHTRLPHLQFDALIATPLLEVKESLANTFVVVIDALDECDNKETTSQILDILLTKTLNLPVRFIVSSRPEPEIRDEMQKQNDAVNSRVVLHELDRHAVQADIEVYLRATLAPMSPTEEQILTLVGRAGVLFIYAATVVRYISHNRFRHNPRARLANVLESLNRSKNQHKEIDGLYTTILQAALDDPNLEEGERKDMQQVLHTVICAQEPLTVNAICGLLDMDDAEQVRAGLFPLWSVLHISGETELVTTLHASFPDYMFDSSRSGRYHCSRVSHNQCIARLCFDSLRRLQPQFNICGLESSFVRDDEVEGIEERIQSSISTELFYASRYWAVHLHHTRESPDLLQQLEELLSTRLLLWMEVMNLKKCAGDMPRLLRLLDKWKVERSTELDALLHDAWPPATVKSIISSR